MDTLSTNENPVVTELVQPSQRYSDMFGSITGIAVFVGIGYGVFKRYKLWGVALSGLCFGIAGAGISAVIDQIKK